MAQSSGRICLTFDDMFVDHWVAALPLLQDFEASVTFCVCKLHTLDADAIAGLHQLQDAGHEIAFHTRNHHNAATFIEQHGIDAWAAQELDHGIAEHRAAGFPATSFAAAFHVLPPPAAKAVKHRFRVGRSSGPWGRTDVDITRRIYKTPRDIVHCAGWLDTCHPKFPGWRHINHILQQTAAAGGVSVFAGHDIVAQSHPPGFHMTLDDLGHLLDLARAHGLGFCTLSDTGP